MVNLFCNYASCRGKKSKTKSTTSCAHKYRDMNRQHVTCSRN
ncbi:unnamed protein product [Linum tenue]|uniref:Uncharacterized protein n=1 Tax=Linum tenue TaxID=586396 RepID=A0AAV0H0Y6_9ROSI|nr:unnamed protein product [Linum tenue]